MGRTVLTDEAKDEIFRLREEEGWSYPRIARAFGVTPSAIQWHCLRLGAEPPAPQRFAAPKPGLVSKRNGREVRRFSAHEDAELLRLAADGHRPSHIGRMLDPPRRCNVVVSRLLSLARLDARMEALQESARVAA